MELFDAFHANQPHGFLKRYAIDLLYADTPVLDREQISERLRIRCPEVELLPEIEDKAVRFRLKDPGTGLSPIWALESRSRPLDGEILGLAIDQSWWWRAGAEVLPECTAGVRLVDDHIADLDHARRISLFQRILVSILEAEPCLVIHWGPTQQLVDPIELINHAIQDGFTNPLPGAVNVRLFRLADEDQSGVPGEVNFLMDTLGLTAVGLRDFQCHFRGLNPEDVSRTLYNTALYVWEKGQVIEDGNTVEGPDPKDEWQCHHELSIASPDRDLIDLHPGFPFAAGEETAK